MAHGDVDKNTLDRNIARFNAPDNANGIEFKIIVGSSQIKESYEIKSVQHLMIMSVPTNIPSLIQIFGRCVRKNSHMWLPDEQRVVHVRIYISTVPKHGGGGGDANANGGDGGGADTDIDDDEDVDVDAVDTTTLSKNVKVDRKDLQIYYDFSYESNAYYRKLLDYIVVQDIEKTLHEYAIDAEIHRDTIMTQSTISKYFPNGTATSTPTADIGALYYGMAVHHVVMVIIAPASTLSRSTNYRCRHLTHTDMVARKWKQSPRSLSGYFFDSPHTRMNSYGN
jgi:hypothetical protein